MDTVVHPVIVLKDYDAELQQSVGDRAVSRAILRSIHIPTPGAFVITESAFYQCIHYSNLHSLWMNIFSQTKPHDLESVVYASQELQQHIKKFEFPESLIKEISKAYRSTIGSHWAHLTISPTRVTKAPTDMPLPVIKGEVALLDFLRQLWAIQLSPHALSLHLAQFNSAVMGISPIMVSEFEPAISSGKVYSVDPQTKDKNIIRIESIWGTNPNNDVKPIPTDVTLITKDAHFFVTRDYNEQQTEIVADRYGTYVQRAVPIKRSLESKISDDDSLKLCAFVQKIHNHQMQPIAANWLKTKSALYITRFEQLSLDTQIQERRIAPSAALSQVHVIAKGIAVSPGIVTAPLCRFIPTTESYLGRIVFIEEPSLTMLHKLKTATGIVVGNNGITTEVAYTCREMGIPIVIGVGNVQLPFNQTVTLDASKGVLYQEKSKPVSKIVTQHVIASTPKETEPRHATKIMLHVSQYDRLDQPLYLAANGVGWCRGNMLMTYQGIHPRWWIEHRSGELKTQMLRSLQEISHAFGDREVWYCLYDLPRNDASRLTHGEHYEHPDINPMFGFRGAYRIMNDPKVTEFELDCLAELKTVYHCANVHVVIPFVRSADEYVNVKRLISGHKLTRSNSNLLAAEIVSPSALQWISKLADTGIDALHLNLDPLHMLIHGYDLFDPEFNQLGQTASQSLANILKQFVNTAHLYKLPLLVKGSFIDQHKDYMQTVIETGVTAVVVNPPQFESVRGWVCDIERRITSKHE